MTAMNDCIILLLCYFGWPSSNPRYGEDIAAMQKQIQKLEVSFEALEGAVTKLQDKE